MHRSLRVLAPVVVAASLLGTAACGSSGNASKDGSNAAACQKLKADTKSLNSLGSVTSPSELESKINDAAKKLTGDASSGNQQLKDAIAKATDALKQIVADAKNGNSAAIQNDTKGLDSIGTDLNKACPLEATQSP